jgi:hypothetical protein
VDRDVEGKVHPVACREGTVGGRVIALLFFLFTLVLGDVGWLLTAPATLSLGMRCGAHCIGGLVGPRIVLDGCGKSCFTVFQSPDCPACSESSLNRD